MMSDFTRDLTILINEGVIATNDGNIRFVYRYPERMCGGIEALELTDRSYNCCRRNGISTIEEIGAKWKTLGNMRSSGIKTVKDVKNKYVQYYYSLLSEEERKDFWRDTIEATINM